MSECVSACVSACVRAGGDKETLHPHSPTRTKGLVNSPYIPLRDPINLRIVCDMNTLSFSGTAAGL